MADIDQYGRAAAAASRRAREESVLIEYCLLAGINDSEECAHALGALLQPLRDLVFVNVIPYNPVPGKPYKAPSHEVTWHFGYVLMAHYGVRAHARRQLGASVAAACGQLAKFSTDDIEDHRMEPQATVEHRQVTPEAGCKSSTMATFTWVLGTVTVLLVLGVATALVAQGAAHARRRHSVIGG